MSASRSSATDTGSDPETVWSRIPGAVLPSLTALLLGGLAVELLGADIPWPPLLRAVMRISLALMAGTGAAALAVFAIRGLRGNCRVDAARRVTPPAALGGLCPACGARTAGDAPCDVCELPLPRRADDWLDESWATSGTWAMNSFALGLGAGLSGTGLALIASTVVTSPSPLWAVVSFVGGPALAVAGGFFLLAGWRLTWTGLHRMGRWSYEGGAARSDLSCEARARAVVRANRIVRADGDATMVRALAALGDRDSLSPPARAPNAAERAFARSVAFLHHRGHVALTWRREARWRTGAGDDTRTVEEHLAIQFLAPREDAAAAPLLDALTGLGGRGSTTAAELWRRCATAGVDLSALLAASGPETYNPLAERAVAVAISSAAQS